MDGPATAGILRAFADMPDPRAHNVTHRLHDMIVIAACAVICGADGWAEVEEFGESKLSFFKTFLDLPGGIPSHDTFGRVFALLDPAAFERCFLAWMAAVVELAGGRLVAVDGKAIRRSFEHAWDASGMVHLVSAFASANSVVFAQVATDAKSNEIEAIPRLLALLDLEGATVTIDAIGCQREVAAEVTQRAGRYVLAVKENQPTLHAKVKAILDEAILDRFTAMSHDRCEETCGGHGRIEVRRAWVTDEVTWLGAELLARWPGLRSIAAVECERTVAGGGGGGGGSGTRSVERRYFITSLAGDDAAGVLGAVRGHWGIENKLHWQLDVSFREDQCRVRVGHGAENLSRLRRLALNLLKRDKSVKVGINGKRRKAGWDEHYLLRVLTA
jgi:predicted transposase YbfD/YdcC